MVIPAKFFHANTVLFVEIPTLFSPIIEELIVISWFYEKLHFHLFKFTGSENKVFSYNFVTESLSYLSNSKRNFHTVRLDNIFVVYINTLSSFRAKIHNTCRIFCSTNMSFKHQVKSTWFS